MDSAKWKIVKKTFSAVSELPLEARENFWKDFDPEIKSEVENLLAAHEKADDFIAEPVLFNYGLTDEKAEVDFTGEYVGSYKILERIGVGGMGAVYLAERINSDFKQKVALKLIKRGMDSEAILKRFATERRILSQLKHPNIASLLDGGISDEGLPFFVMEYVEGMPLNRFCRENDLTLESRLEIFCQICAAVEHAHKNLIVHRDLKPSNIIVTADGTPKLLDFGIAKLLSDEDSEITVTQGNIFTPEYASPEQILGKTVTTATDIYSLGVILYEILSGHRPFETKGKSYEEIVKSVCETEPERPSSVVGGRWSVVGGRWSGSKNETSENEGRRTKNEGQKDVSSSTFRVPQSALRGDLDNIALKALRKEPSERYGTVQQFSEDVSRFLKGLPVSARPQTFKYRFEKYVKRHKAGVFAASMVLLSLVGGISVATWQAIVARRERERAEQRFNDVRKLANTILFEYSDGAEKLAGSTSLREKMVKDMLEYLDRISSESGEDLQREIAAAYQKVGDVQGNPYTSNLGDQDSALDSYKKSLAIRENLVAADAENPPDQFGLAQSFERLGDIYWGKGNNAESLDNYRRALAIYEKLNSGGNLTDLISLPRTYFRLGETQEQAGNFDGALESHLKGLEKINDLSSKEPANPLYKRWVSIGLGKIGDVFYQRDEYPKAAEYYQQSLPILRDLSANDPTNTNHRRSYCMMLARIALVEMQAGEYSKSVEFHKQSIQIAKELADADPNNAQMSYVLADIVSNLGEAYGLMKDYASAEKTFQESFVIYREVLQKNPNFAQTFVHIASTYNSYAEMLFKSGKPESALETYRQALKQLENQPVEAETAELLTKIYEGTGDIQISLKQNSEALKAYQNALTIQQDAKGDVKRVTQIEEKISKLQTFAGK